MANFVYNQYRTGKVLDLAENQKQWYDYLQKKEFHDDLTKSLKSEGESYRKDLQRNAELAGKDMNALRQEFSQASEHQLEAIHEQTRAITESANMICGTLDEGFSEVSGKLDDICATLDWRLTAIEDQLRISNMLSENIALLLRVPDFQKERQYYIDQGLKHYKNVWLDSDLYEDALKNLLEAEPREPTDYVVLHRLGLIYLYADKEEILNLAKAEEYFRRAAKYAIVESNPDALRTLNLLAGDTRQFFSEQTTTPEAAKEVAAKAYFQAGVACYAQGKFPEAVELSSKAFSLLPSLLEAGFIQAKSLAVLGQSQESVKILHGIIQTERFYSVKTVLDGDLAPKIEIQSMLQQLRNSAIQNASNKLSKVKQEILSDGQAKPFLSEIANLLSQKTYLDALKALDNLTEKKKWKRPKIVGQKVEWVVSEESFSIEEFVDIEKQYRNEAVWLEQENQNRIKLQAEDKARRERERLNREEGAANEILADYFKTILIRILPTIGVAFIAWLVIGSGGCIARGLSAADKSRLGDPVIDIFYPQAWSNEGMTAAMIVVGISATILAIEFIQALVKYSAAKSKIR